MAKHHATIAQGGRIVIPAELCGQLGLQPGTEVMLDAVDGALRIRPLTRAVERARALVRRHVPTAINLADELIAERREAALLE